MIQCIKVLAAKPVNPSWIPWIRLVEGENDSCKLSSDLPMSAMGICPPCQSNQYKRKNSTRRAPDTSLFCKDCPKPQRKLLTVALKKGSDRQAGAAEPVTTFPEKMQTTSLSKSLNAGWVTRPLGGGVESAIGNIII